MKLSQKRQMQATLPWWIAVQKTINDFAEMIEQSPTAQFEKADEKASQLKDMYENV